MRRVRRSRSEARATGYIVTWDVDSSDRRTAEKLRRFVYGTSPCVNGRVYRYPGFVDRPGVRYLGQSVLFVPASLLAFFDAWLCSHGIDHEAIRAVLG